MGAGTGIPSIRSFGQRRQRNREVLIRINPRESQGPKGTISIPMGAKSALEGIDQIITEKKNKSLV